MTKFAVTVLAAVTLFNQRCQLLAINRPTPAQSRILSSRTLTRVITSTVHPLSQPSWAMQRVRIISTRRGRDFREPRIPVIGFPCYPDLCLPIGPAERSTAMRETGNIRQIPYGFFATTFPSSQT